jgi:hypothetical protein
VNRKTIVRRFLLFGRISLEKLEEQNQKAPLVRALQFDDLETFEHTKCKPLSVTLAVEHPSRRVNRNFEFSSGLFHRIACPEGLSRTAEASRRASKYSSLMLGTIKGASLLDLSRIRILLTSPIRLRWVPRKY